MRIAQSLVLALLLITLLAGRAAQAGDCRAGACLSGETVSIVVGYGAGGGYDAYARLIAPELERRTGATVVVRNRPGGGGLVALNELASGPADGLTLGLVNVTAAVIAQGLDMEAVRFDLRRLAWLAGIAAEKRSLIARSGNTGLPWEDTPRGHMRWAAGSRADDLAIGAALISSAFGLDARIITGYKGTNEAVLGVIRGEADAAIISADSARQYQATREIDVVTIIASERSALFPDVPTFYEVAADTPFDADKLDLLTTLSGLGRGIATRSDAPRERIGYLRGVLGELLADETFRARVEAAGRRIAPQTPDEIAAMVTTSLSILTDDRDLRHVLLEQYR